ncbi:MAG: SGNH/GDSL hydrolase family protein [Planctomycetes bacterium]|nr:SGNH/GDSL hydrolase family protein [Planctomycetota bacterium]MBL7043434.1 SGNH/GDSL hydrolase family protein [Pirellulaceae bacterium]
MTRLKSATKKLALLLASLALGLIVAEVCLRILGVSYPLPYAPDEFCGTRLRPGFEGWWKKEGSAFVRINRYGFRHGDRPPAKAPDTLRVAVLGDSYIEAFQVSDDETFCAALERELSGCSAVGGRPVEVLNFGVSGYGTAQELLMLKHHVRAYAPDIVVLVFFAGNDVRNNSWELEPYKVRPFFRLENESLTLDNSFHEHADYVKARSKRTEWKVALINRVRLLQLLNETRNNWRHRAADDPTGVRGQPGIDELAHAAPRDATWERAWELTERLIMEVDREARRQGAEFVLVSATNAVQVNPDRAVREASQERLQVDDLFYAERRLQALGRTNGFPTVDLAEPMQRYADKHGAFLHGFENTKLGEGHWNAAGHRLAAQITAEAICASLGSEETPSDGNR